MIYDPHGVVSRWWQSARPGTMRGTLASIAGAYAALLAVAFAAILLLE